MIEESEVRKILVDYPLVIELYEEVKEFYGDGLIIRDQDPLATSSRYQLNLTQEALPKFISAEVMLVRESGREESSLAHELLHLALLARGFPSITAIGIPSTNSAHKAVIMHNMEVLFNMLDHETFLDEYLSFGLERDKFIRDRTTSDLDVDEAALVKIIEAKGFQAARLSWGMFYITEYLADQFGPDLSRSKDVAAMMAKHLVSGAEDVQMLNKWIAARTYTNPETRKKSVEQLFKALSDAIPVYKKVRRGKNAIVIDPA